MSDTSDQELMSGIREGQSASLALLMERHWDKLYAYSRRRVGSPDEAEDLAQEVFVRIWTHRERWSATGPVLAYLYRVLRNLISSRVRMMDVRTRYEDAVGSLATDPPTPFHELKRREIRDALERALSGLPERRREAFVLVRVDGLSLAEAAEAMEVSYRTVVNHVYMATSDLERALRYFSSE